MGPFVKKATLYTGDVSRVWTQEIIPVEDFFHAVPQYFTPSTADDSFIFFQLLSSPDVVAVFET